MIRSIEMILGLDPMNRFDALADPITTCFTNFFAADAPDFSTPHIVCGPGRSRAPAC
jgi:hypothetical protein